MAFQSIFNINKVYNPELEAVFTVNNGTFTTNGQFFIMQHSPAIQNLTSITQITDSISSVTDTNNYFTKEIRWSFDIVTWTAWSPITSTGGTSFPTTNAIRNVWFQIKYTWNTNASQIGSLEEVTILGVRKINPIFEPIVLADNTPAVFTNADTYKVFSIEDVKVFAVNDASLDNIDMHFRYTQTQGRSWSNWYKLTADNLKSIKFDPIRFCNFQFGFQNNSGTNFAFFDIELVGKFQNITAAYATTALLGLKTQCLPDLTETPPDAPCDANCLNGDSITSIYPVYGTDGKGKCLACSTANTPWSTVVGTDCSSNNNCDDSLGRKNTKEMYSVRASINAYLNEKIAVRSGFTMTYALADPDRKGTDPILHECQLHNILMIRNINVVVPDGQFPSDEITLSGLDLDLIQTFEIQIPKKSFKDTFGVEFRPGNKDFIYFCDMNQMWEVDQMIPARKAYNAENVWRVLLKKYNDRKSRQFVNPSDKALVDSLTAHNTLDGLFGIQEDMEYQRVGKNQNIDINNTAQLNNHQSEFSFIKNIDAFVEYTKDQLWNSSLTLSESQYKFKLTSKGKKLVTYNHYDRVVKKGDNRAISMWFKTEKFNTNWDYTLLSNYDYGTNKGYKLDLFGGTLNFILNGNTYNLLLNGLLEVNTWYCIFVNLYQQQEEVELVIYKRQSETGSDLADSKLIQVVKNVIKIQPDSFSHVEDIFIGGVDLNTSNSTGVIDSWYLTNIRIYKQQIPKNKRNIVLNEKVPSDTQLTLLVDNAEAKFNMPDHGNL